MKRPPSFDDFPNKLAVPFGPYRAVVSEITDGDTIICMIDFGWNEYRFAPIRFRGIDAPEVFGAKSSEAGYAARAVLEALIPPGTPVILFTEKDRKSFGRYVADVWTLNEKGDAYDVGTEMVTTGHAVWRDD